MSRCEGYYKLENRRCDRDGRREVRGADGQFYLVCDYHAKRVWTALVARWNGQSDLRRSFPTEIRPGVKPTAA